MDRDQGTGATSLKATDRQEEDVEEAIQNTGKADERRAGARLAREELVR